MLVTISGRQGEGKTCVANIIRNALARYGCVADMGNVPVIDHEVAVDILFPSGPRGRGDRVEIRIREEEET